MFSEFSHVFYTTRESLSRFSIFSVTRKFKFFASNDHNWLPYFQKTSRSWRHSLHKKLLLCNNQEHILIQHANHLILDYVDNYPKMSHLLKKLAFAKVCILVSHYQVTLLWNTIFSEDSQASFLIVLWSSFFGAILKPVFLSFYDRRFLGQFSSQFSYRFMIVFLGAQQKSLSSLKL